MQTTLLGLAIALILALVTAIVAPLVVDWNHYRDPFEAEASRLTGMSVRINGSIDARLVPTPVITLHDVVAGAPRPADAPEAEPLLRAGEIKLELGLGALLRGKIEATDARVIEPEVHVGLDRSGALTVPALASSSQPGAMSIGRVSVENGRIVLTDAVSRARLVLQKLWFDGEMTSFAGPFNGRGATVVGDQLYGYRISGSPTRGGTQIRLGVDPSDMPLTAQFDGTLKFASGVPSFDGAVAASRPVGATLANGKRVLSVPWRAAGALKLTPSAAQLSAVTFRYGPEERALNFSASAGVTLGATPHLFGKVSAMGLDVDRALAAPDVTDRPPLVVIRSFLPAFLAGAKLPMPAKIALSVDSLTVGGTTLDSLSGNLDFDQGAWTLDNFAFHAPGLTQVSLNGRLSGAGEGFAFTGPAKLASSDFETLLAWLDGRNDARVSKEVKTFTAEGDITLASDRVAVEQLTAALGEETVAGRLAYQWSRSDRPARIDADLRAASLDLDALSGFAASALGGGRFGLPQEAALKLDIGRATYGGVRAQAINAAITLDAGKLEIDRLAVGDLAGAKLALSGQIDALASRPRGALTLDLDAASLDGLGSIAAKFAPQAAAALQRAAGQLAPAKVHAVLDVGSAASAGSIADLHLSGSLAAMRIALDGTASGQTDHPGAAAVQIDSHVDADNGAALIALLGLDRVLAVDQLPGRLTLAAKGPLDGNIRVDGKAEASGLDSAVTGTLRLAGHPASWGEFQVQATAADLRPLQRLLTGQPGAAAPVTARAAVAIGGGKFAVTDIVAHAGQSSLGGHVALDFAKNPIAIDGAITADMVDAPAATALLLGLPANGSGATGSSLSWSDAALGGGAFAPVAGSVSFKIAQAALTPSLKAQDVAGVARFTPAAITLDDIDARLAGGHVNGSLAFARNADGLTLHSRLGLTDVAASAIASPGLQVTGGDLTMALTSDGAGATPADLIGSLHGGGSVTLKGVQFAGLDPAAFEAARQAVGPDGAIDPGKVQSAVSAALARGHLTVPQGEAAITIASGVVTLKRVALEVEGGAALSLAAAVDLNGATGNAEMSLSEAPPPAALIDMRPELSVSITGPLATPLRTLDLSALNSWLSLSAAELQTRRIEMIEANRQRGPQTLSPPVVAPGLHTLSPGTVLESEMPAKLRAMPTPGARGLERLRLAPAAPATPATPGPSAPGSGDAGGDAMRALLAPFVPQPKPAPKPRAHKPAAAVGAAETPPQSAPPSPGAPRAD